MIIIWEFRKRLPSWAALHTRNGMGCDEKNPKYATDHLKTGNFNNFICSLLLSLNKSNNFVSDPFTITENVPNRLHIDCLARLQAEQRLKLSFWNSFCNAIKVQIAVLETVPALLQKAKVVWFTGITLLRSKLSQSPSPSSLTFYK